jgi:hypothetical protein
MQNPGELPQGGMPEENQGELPPIIGGPLWDWMERKTHNRNSIELANSYWPTEKSVGAIYRTMHMWTPMQQKKFAAMIKSLKLNDEE